jgi:hypothetical protein
MLYFFTIHAGNTSKAAHETSPKTVIIWFLGSYSSHISIFPLSNFSGFFKVQQDNSSILHFSTVGDGRG